MDLNRLTEKAQEAIRQAHGLAERQGHPQIDAEHLAIALLTQDEGVAMRVLNRALPVEPFLSPAVIAERETRRELRPDASELGRREPGERHDALRGCRASRGRARRRARSTFHPGWMRCCARPRPRPSG